MEYIQVSSLDQLNELLENNPVSLVYFSHDHCNVCKVLKPKVAKLIRNNFLRISLYYVNTVENPEISGQHAVFTVPTILLFFEGKEYIRESRHISLDMFEEKVSKLYYGYFE